ncbi:MAG TPA: HNH endonuclease family protein [Solirubrobacteraceae bacterium]|jgi:hypothetical protein
MASSGGREDLAQEVWRLDRAWRLALGGLAAAALVALALLIFVADGTASTVLLALAFGWSAFALLVALLWRYAGPPPDGRDYSVHPSVVAWVRSAFLATGLALLVALALGVTGTALALAAGDDGDEPSAQRGHDGGSSGGHGAEVPQGAEAPQTAGAPEDELPPPAPALPAPSEEESRAALARLETAEPLPMKGYDRKAFPHWAGQGRGCDTRKLVLLRDGREVSAEGCRIESGTWVSYYDNATIDSARDVDVDHIVPLAHAWRSGAKAWTRDERRAFANDLDDSQLLAVSASSNRAKGDKGPAKWKPDVATAWCLYARWWIQVKERWSLTTTSEERDDLGAMLDTC